MEAITKVSEITITDVADYLRLPEPSESDMVLLGNIIGVAKTFIEKYTGQTDLDSFQDFVIVVFILCQDMWDNRTLYVDKSNLNKVVDTILGMHSVNLLPEAEADNA
jgi:hypothetical protein